jgi:hypothetical protein
MHQALNRLSVGHLVAPNLSKSLRPWWRDEFSQLRGETASALRLANGSPWRDKSQSQRQVLFAAISIGPSILLRSSALCLVIYFYALLCPDLHRVKQHIDINKTICHLYQT